MKTTKTSPTAGTPSAPFLSPGAASFLLKCAGTRKGVIPLAELGEVVGLLPGWRLERGDAPRKIGGVDLDSANRAVARVREILGDLARNVTQYGALILVESPVEVVKGEWQAQQAEQQIKAGLREVCTVLTDRTPDPEGDHVRDALVLRRVEGYWSDGAKLPQGWRIPACATVYIRATWIGQPHATLRAPDGGTFRLWPRVWKSTKDGSEHLSTEVESGSFWTWAGEAGFREACKELLARLDPKRVDLLAHPGKAERMEHAGTCQICAGVQKWQEKGSRPVLVDHGYVHEEVLRHGQGISLGYRHYELGRRVPFCAGVGELPFEIDKSGLERHLSAVLRPEVARLEAAIASLNAEEVRDLVTHDWNPSSGKTEDRTVHPGERGWAEALSRAVSKLETELRHARYAVRRAEERLAAWKPQPLDGWGGAGTP
jgi:hypothetical protein